MRFLPSVVSQNAESEELWGGTSSGNGSWTRAHGINGTSKRRLRNKNAPGQKVHNWKANKLQGRASTVYYFPEGNVIL